jgi:integrase
MGRRSNEELKANGATPRMKGEGTVFHVPDRKSGYRAVRTIEINGKRRQISGSGATEEQAILQREKNVIKELGKTQAGYGQAEVLQKAVFMIKKLTPSSTLEELMYDWLEWRKYQTLPSKKISGAVRKQYETHIRLHLGPSELGRMKISEIRRNDIETYFFKELPRHTKRIVREGEEVEVPYLSASNQRAQQSIVNMALNYAVHPLGLLQANPAIGMERIQKSDGVTTNTGLEKKRKMAYKLAELLMNQPDEARWMLQLLTGARQSEILGATWSESFLYLFDKAEEGKPPRFIIQQQLVRDPDARELKKVKRTKSRSSTRVVPLDPRMVEILWHHKQQQEAQQAWAKEQQGLENQRPLKAGDTRKVYWSPQQGMEDLVFCEPNGRPTTHQRDHKRWRALLEKFSGELEGDTITMHGLRHLCASILATTPGVSLEHIRQVLGHGSTAVTSAVYLHIGAQNLEQPIHSYTSAIFRDRDLKAQGKEVPAYSDEEYYDNLHGR